MQTIPDIVLGPLLGVESDTKYSVCLLANDCIHDPILSVSGHLENICIEQRLEILDKYIFYRYSFNIDPDILEKTNQFIYSINYTSNHLPSNLFEKFWLVKTPDQNDRPSIAFVSCNGYHNSYPSYIPKNSFLGWKKINEVRPDYLIITGDQIYADSIIEKIPKLIFTEADLIKNALKIEEFYVKLYIDSWSNKHMRKALATIPNIMTWDDHDIIDGYGSYNDQKQKDLIPLFNIARKYYQLFQLRSACHNKSLSETEDGVFNQYIKLRGFHCFLPDTRSNRTQKQILSSQQYQWLENHALNPPAEITPKQDDEGEKLLMVLPVPIAHLDFYSFIDDVFEPVEKKSIKKLVDLVDDNIDHWDHKYHKEEQKRMMNLLFNLGEAFRIKHLIIVSGDVHSAGASSIVKMTMEKKEERFATQLITSPIVNKPTFRLMKFTGKRNKFITDEIGYSLNNFGNLRNWLITKRNFMIVRWGSNGYHSTIYMEGKKDHWITIKDAKFHRTLNLFKESQMERIYLKFLKWIKDLFN